MAVFIGFPPRNFWPRPSQKPQPTLRSVAPSEGVRMGTWRSVYVWMIYEQHIGNIWTIYEQYMDNIWIIYEQYMDNINILTIYG